MTKIILKHKTPNRMRLFCKELDITTNESTLSKAIKKIENVLHVRVNLKNKNIIIKYKNDSKDILQKLDTFDFKSYNSTHPCFTCTNDEIPSKKPMFYAFSALSLSPLVKNNTTMFALTSLAALPVFKDGIKELFTQGVTSKVLEASAVGASMIRDDYLAANATNVMLSIGEYIEETTVHKSNDLIKELAKPNVQFAWLEVVKNGKVTEKQVSTSKLKVGDIIIVNSGDTIPVDGHVMSEEAMINQVSMTGEAEPVSKKRGDKVMSGTIVEEGRLRVWAEQVGDDTATARIKKYIESSLNEKSSIGLKASELAERLVPVTLGLAGVAYLVNRDLQSVASVLQADYSCALKLATPVAFKSAISQAGRDGVLIKGAKSIEALSEVDTFVFDKTGTLTHGNLEVVKVTSFDKKWSEKDLLNLTASAEEHYFHPVAQAVVEAAKEKGFIHIHHEEVNFIVAHGVKTIVNDKEVVIGSRHFLEEDEHISFAKHEKSIDKCLDNGRTLLYVGYDGELLGTISMIDKVRHNTKKALNALRKLGAKEIIMLTGDVDEKAQKIAKEVGVDTVYSQLLPTQKAAKVKELKEKGVKLAFVGDGINDAPALINANVGISMFKGADIAKATADISLLKDDIMAVAEAKELANKTMSRISQHFNATVGINSTILLGATAGLFSPITTAFLHNGTTIGLLLNSMQPHRINTAKFQEK